MADEQVQKTIEAPVEQEVVVVADVTDAQTTPATAPPLDKHPSPVTEEEEPLNPNQVRDDDKVPQSNSFQEESNRVADLPDNEKKALQELKQLVQEALNNREFSRVAEAVAPKEEEKKEAAAEVVTEDEVVAGEAKETEKQEEGEKVQVVETEKVTATPSNADVVDDDGAKTVEAIEETIVTVSTSSSSSSSSSVQQDHQQPEAANEAEADPALEEKKEAKTEDASIWGIPLLADERSDVILLKFLRARDFKVKDAFTMLKNTLRWRKEFGIDELIEQDMGCDELEKVVFMHGQDKEGHPVCYNIYGEFQNKELYQKTFSDEEKRQKFLRWRIQFLEKSIRKLDFNPGGICTIVQINDLKNSPGPGKWELRQATKQALQLLQDNYPEFVARQVFINVPWWYLAVNRMISPFLTQRTRSKFVFAGPSKSAETLLRYIAAEQVPVKYGGLSKDGEFDTTDAVTEITVKPAAKHTVEFPVTETCMLTWEVRVVGWEVSYGAEFVPSSEESYTVIIQKGRRVGWNEEPVICNSFKIGEAGKVVVTIQNPTSKKKKLLYRLKIKPCSD
ncbi:patellin-3-like isoform X1 [Carica papaya]|uniref:patellin-3-like isoform X1 n=1 Tax=Carica papaya TaxID=3649 RepID=UPI000B8D0475|nr:patellin-3-like isoform X1 [Carica papaya]